MAADFSQVNAATSYINQGFPRQAHLSINSSLLAPETHSQLINKYGNIHKIGLFDFINLPQRKIYVKNQDYTIWSKWASEKAIRLGAVVSDGSAGAAINLVMHSSMMDAAGNFPARIGFDVVIPGKYQTSGQTRIYRVMSYTTTTETNDTLVAYPYSNAATYIQASQIGTQIPADTYLMLGASSWAPGTGQPASLTDTYTSEIFRARILKETYGAEGGFGSSSFWKPIEVDLLGGGKGIMVAEKVKAEMRLLNQLDKMCMTGETNDNASLVGTSNMTGSNVIKSGIGFDLLVDTYGQKCPYTDDPSFDDFEDIGKLAETQGVAAQKFDGYLGVEIARKLGNLTKEIIKDYSGGSDLIDSAKKQLGVNVSEIRWGNNLFYLHTLASTGHNGAYGVMSGGVYTYHYPTTAYWVPQEMNEVDMKSGNYLLSNKDGGYDAKEMGKTTLPNIMMGYINAGGENRERFGGLQVGPNGHGLGDGFLATEYDESKGYVNTHAMFIMTNANHIVKQSKLGT